MKILIFEDELYNFRMLKHMLEEIDPEYDIMGPLASIEQGRDFFQYDQDVDIIIADILLNDGLSFDALKYAPATAPIIFTTAYDEYALRAFEYNSLSYLLKPIDEEQLKNAINKAQRLAAATLMQDSDFINDTISAHWGYMNEIYRERFVVKAAKGDKIILVANARYIFSEQKTTYIRLLDGSSYPIDMTLETISKQLNPKKFMRVNRKYIVPIEQVSHTERIENGKMRIFLKGNKCPDIIVSRTRKEEVCKWIDS